MLGGMLAGHDQSGGEIIEKNGKKVCAYSQLETLVFRISRFQDCLISRSMLDIKINA